MKRNSKVWVVLVCGIIAASLAIAARAQNNKKVKEEKQEKIIALKNAPAPVQATIIKETAGGEIKEIEEELENGKIVYSAEFVKDGKKKEIHVAADGSLMKEDDNEDEDDEEESVPYESLPAAVKAAVEKHLGGAGPFKAKVETKKGVKVFEIESKTSEQDVSIEVTESGDPLEIEREIPAQNLPPAIIDKIIKKFPEGKIKEAEQVQKFYYEIEITENGKTKEIIFSPTGEMKKEKNDKKEENDDD